MFKTTIATSKPDRQGHLGAILIMWLYPLHKALGYMDNWHKSSFNDPKGEYMQIYTYVYLNKTWDIYLTI